MSKKTTRYFMNLSKMWGHSCYLCGIKFNNISSITRDHMVAKQNGGKDYEYNIGPAHDFCNSIKGSKSIIETVKLLSKLKEEFGEEALQKMVNKKVSNIKRQSPFYAQIPIESCYQYMNQRNLIEHKDRIKGAKKLAPIGFRIGIS